MLRTNLEVATAAVPQMTTGVWCQKEQYPIRFDLKRWNLLQKTLENSLVSEKNVSDVFVSLSTDAHICVLNNLFIKLEPVLTGWWMKLMKLTLSHSFQECCWSGRSSFIFAMVMSEIISPVKLCLWM